MERRTTELKEKDCVFCDVSASNFPHFDQFGVKRLDQYLIAETDHFLVKPDIIPGNPDGRHVLVFPKFHTYNHAGLVQHTSEIGGLIYNLEEKLGPLVVFEHGGLKPGNSVQSIYHAHFHAYGGLEGVNVIEWMKHMLSGELSDDERYPYEVVPAPDYAFLANLTSAFNGHPYLYVEQGPWAIIAHDPQESMKSQITQRSMHKLFSGEILDWKKIPQNEQFARESVRRMSNLIGFCENGIMNTHRF